MAAEVLYPSFGMLLCNHPDFDYKHACFSAYNEWIAEYQRAHPDRLLGSAKPRCAVEEAPRPPSA